MIPYPKRAGIDHRDLCRLGIQHLGGGALCRAALRVPGQLDQGHAACGQGYGEQADADGAQSEACPSGAEDSARMADRQGWSSPWSCLTNADAVVSS